MERKEKEKNLFQASFLLGLGFLGAIDGIVFHQLLQWHHLVDHPNKAFEVFTDGLFTTLFSALFLLSGYSFFVFARNKKLGRKWSSFVGGVLAGGGTFNLVEGIVNHHILQVHRVNPTSENPMVYDIGFLALGLLLIFSGTVIYTRNSNRV